MKRQFGPAMPPGFKKRPAEEEPEREHRVLGPALLSQTKTTQHESSDDEYGPQPTTKQHMEILERQEFHNKLVKIGSRIPKLTEPEIIKRPDWMLTPNIETKNQVPDLKSRTFQRKTIDNNIDHELWTATPKERETKENNLKIKIELPKVISEKDLLYQEIVDRHNEMHRPMSLVEQNKKQGITKAKDHAELKRFDRERDIITGTRFDSSKKNDALDSKFAKGSGSSFL
jgi:hypothetical protein